MSSNETSDANLTEEADVVSYSKIEAELEQNTTDQDYHMIEHIDLEGMKKKVRRHEHYFPHNANESDQHSNIEMIRHDGAQHLEASNSSDSTSESTNAKTP